MAPFEVFPINICEIIENQIVKLNLQESTLSCRVFHGRGHTYAVLEDINIDYFTNIVLITLYQPIERIDGLNTDDLTKVIEQVSNIDGVECVYLQHRYERGSPIEVVAGEECENCFAYEADMRFKLNFGQNQNIGFFLDMKTGREWIRNQAQGKNVLNLFAYTCSIGVAAMAGGAQEAVNVDMSKGAIQVGQQNDKFNQDLFSEHAKARFLSYDIFRSWKKIERLGPYDIVVLDPPSRQPGSFVAEKDYARLVRRLPKLVKEGGKVLACLNAPHLPPSFITDLFETEAPDFSFEQRLPIREDFPEADDDKALKLFVYERTTATDDVTTKEESA